MRRFLTASIAVVLMGLSAGRGDALEPEPSARPDLVPFPPSGLWLTTADGPNPFTGEVADWLDATVNRRPAATAIRFHSRFTNAGGGSFEIMGVPTGSGISEPGIGTMEAFQCMVWSGPAINGTPRACGSYEPVGTMSWDPNHFHVHLHDFARYSLHEIDENGEIGKVVVTSDKVGFCMQDDTPGAEIQKDQAPLSSALNDLWWFANHGWYKGCYQPPLPGASYRQGLSPGWNDTYYSPYPGQQVVIDDPATGAHVPDGEYLLVHTVNPQGRYVEADYDNNQAQLRLRLTTDAEGGRSVAPA